MVRDEGDPPGYFFPAGLISYPSVNTRLGNSDDPHVTVIPPSTGSLGEQGCRFTGTGAVLVQLLVSRLVFDELHGASPSGGGWLFLCLGYNGTRRHQSLARRRGGEDFPSSDWVGDVTTPSRCPTDG